MASKIYAVKVGKTTGLFNTWSECEASVKGYPGAQFKSFTSKEEAEAYLSGEAIVQNINTIELPKHSYAFVDGSFNETQGVTGCGGFLIDQFKNKHIIQQSSYEPDLVEMRNVGGEILGSMLAITKADELEMTQLTIFYDYQGIESWANGDWKANKTATQKYRDFVNLYRSYGIRINFVKVAGHTGIPGNEEADKLAKEAVGINSLTHR